MSTENVAAAMPRLWALKEHAKCGVALKMEVVISHFGNKVTCEWSVWDGANWNRGDTMDAALKNAESACGLAPNDTVPTEVILPVCGERA